MTQYEPSNWLPGEGIPTLLQGNQTLKGIEIGVDYGTTSVHLLKSMPGLTLYGIDPYITYNDWYGSEVSDREHVMSVMTERTKVFNQRFVHVRKTSDDALNMFEDESMDLIFIDGLHTYEQVLKDCQNYWTKLKKGGLFCGHDFTTIQDVNNAVFYFANQINQHTIGIVPQDVWYWHKD
jgi:hypothetical protein